MMNLQVLCMLPVLALANVFVKINGSTLLHPVLTGPDMAYFGKWVVFQCFVPDSSVPALYELMKDGSLQSSTDYELQENNPANFSIKLTMTSAGQYHCKAKTAGGTGVSNSIRLSVVIPPANTRVTSEPFPPVVYEGSRMVLSCNVTKGSHLSYTWFFNMKNVTPSTFPLLHITGNKLVMEKVTPEHAGNYYCQAMSTVQDMSRTSSSRIFTVVVKVHVLKPTIAFSMYKEGTSFYGNVTCRSSRGTPPVNFSLSLNDTEVGSVTASDFLVAWFSVAMVPGQVMGVARCRVKTEVQELISEPLTLEVVPVGGDAKVGVEYLYTADSRQVAAKLSCHVSRGTFPYVSWLLNNSVLPETDVDSHMQPSLPQYAVTDHTRTLFLTKLGPEESGHYRCKARDSYNDTDAWVESGAVLVRDSGENIKKVTMATTEVIPITFCCFLFLSLVVAVACMYRMTHQKRDHANVTVTNARSDTLPLSAPFSQSGGKLDDIRINENN